MKCYKHQDVDAPLSCGRCERPICTKCYTHTDVGIRCKSCAPAGMRPKMMRTGGSLLGGGILLLVVIVAATSLYDLGGSDEFDYYDEDWFDYQGSVTVSQWLDPWTPENGQEGASAGNRLIAAEVTIENEIDGYPIYVYGSSFKVTDRDGFTFPATTSRLQPIIAEGLPLDPDEKTRGWVMFEVADDTEIAKLQYWSGDVALPDQP